MANNRPIGRATFDPRLPYLSIQKPGHTPLMVRAGSVTFDGDYETRVDVDVEANASGEGKVVVSEISFRHRPGGRPLSSRGVREVNVGSLIADALDRLTFVDDGGAALVPTRVIDAGPEVRRALASRPSGRGRGRPKYSDDELRFVAKACMAAEARGQDKALLHAYRMQSTFELPSSEARKKRVTAARERVDPKTGERFMA
jgi:hypothetical protein